MCLHFKCMSRKVYEEVKKNKGNLIICQQEDKKNDISVYC